MGCPRKIKARDQSTVGHRLSLGALLAGKHFPSSTQLLMALQPGYDVDYELLSKLNKLRKEAFHPSFSDKAVLDQLEKRAEDVYGCSRIFIVYGSLGPGGPNHYRLHDVGGAWHQAFHVNGKLEQAGWGAALGYPGLTWQREGDKVTVDVLVSDKLAQHWADLDALEGEGYLRALVPVSDGKTVVVGNIYLLA